MERSKISHFYGGNIGIPLLDFPRKNNKILYHVIELSSFQLESSNSFDPFISILLNLSPDHLDRYDSFDDYILKKEKILTSNKKGFKIINIDNEKSLQIYNKNKERFIPLSIYPLKKGIFYKDNQIIDNYFDNNKNIDLNILSESLFETFNIENILAAYSVSKILGLNTNVFLDVVGSFKGLPHRMEKIYKNKNLQIINNSKATNLNASLKSIIDYNNIFLILGGRAKEKEFKEILKFKTQINKIYIIGESATKIYKQLNKEIECEIYYTLDLAIKKIFYDIEKNNLFKTILFSPACSSFDQFVNFEERGLYFKKLIKKNLDV